MDFALKQFQTMQYLHLWKKSLFCFFKKIALIHLHSLYTLGKDINSINLPPATSKIVGQTRLFDFGMVPVLEERKLNSNLLSSLWNWPCVAFCSCSGVGKYIQYWLSLAFHIALIPFGKVLIQPFFCSYVQIVEKTGLFNLDW